MVLACHGHTFRHHHPDRLNPLLPPEDLDEELEEELKDERDEEPLDHELPELRELPNDDLLLELKMESSRARLFAAAISSSRRLRLLTASSAASIAEATSLTARPLSKMVAA